ncbi:hypothetical protein WAF17_16495 [Bernardetia sp. ABR2-2B]|uniref:hypothetical protein n=1 Tax=Bernardetia sp. ABR2-2B TaxID=3127472 RepID=UPI0030CB232A
MKLLSKITDFIFSDKAEKRKWHWNNPFEKRTNCFDVYQKGNDNYFKYLRNEMPSTVYVVEIWIEGRKLRQDGFNRFYPRLVYKDKEEAALIAIQTAKIRNLEIEDYRIILSINGHEQMEMSIY